jgi:hypothetical protein
MTRRMPKIGRGTLPRRRFLQGIGSVAAGLALRMPRTPARGMVEPGRAARPLPAIDVTAAPVLGRLAPTPVPAPVAVSAGPRLLATSNDVSARGTVRLNYDAPTAVGSEVA